MKLVLSRVCENLGQNFKNMLDPAAIGRVGLQVFIGKFVLLAEKPNLGMVTIMRLDFCMIMQCKLTHYAISCNRNNRRRSIIRSDF